jgi:FixJ family two-component response regulator
MIFIVDDDDAVRDSWRVLLELEFSQVRAFDSCQQFLGDWGGSTEGCLILDINMPDMSGFDLMERMRADGLVIPVVLVTGRSDAATRARAAELGAVALLEKPVDYAELMSTIRRALGLVA